MLQSLIISSSGLKQSPHTRCTSGEGLHCIDGRDEHDHVVRDDAIDPAQTSRQATGLLHHRQSGRRSFGPGYDCKTLAFAMDIDRRCLK